MQLANNNIDRAMNCVFFFDEMDKLFTNNDSDDTGKHTLHQIAKNASESELGVRSIKQTLKKIFKEALFSSPDGNHKTHEILYEK